MQMIEDRMGKTHDQALFIVQENTDILKGIYGANPEMEVEKGYAIFKEKLDKLEAESRVEWEKEVKDYIKLQAKVDEDTAAQLMAENAEILDQARKEGTNELFTAEKLIEKMPPPVKEVPEDSTDLWRLGTSIFQEHEEKVLGTPYAATGLRGPITLYEGDINDLDKINVPMDWLDQQDPESLFMSQEHVEIETEEEKQPEVELTAEQSENIDKAIATAESDIAKEFLRKS